MRQHILDISKTLLFVFVLPIVIFLVIVFAQTEVSGLNTIPQALKYSTSAFLLSFLFSFPLTKLTKLDKPVANAIKILLIMLIIGSFIFNKLINVTTCCDDIEIGNNAVTF